MNRCPAIAWFWSATLGLAALAGPGRAETGPAPDFPALSGPEFTAVADSYAAARANAAAPHKSRLVTLIQRYRDDAEQMLNDKRKTRNTTGIAVATAAIDIFQSALTNVETSGAFTPPARVRRELEPLMSEFSIAVRRIETDYTNQQERAFREHLDRFAALVYQAKPELKGAMDDAAMAARFRDVLERQSRTPAPAPAGTSAPGTSAASGSTNAPAAKPPLPEILAASGDAPQWVTVGQWAASMAGTDVIAIPLGEMTPGTNRTQKFNPMTGQDSQIDYMCQRPLVLKPGMVFRIKRVGDRQGVDVLEWPTPGNNGTLTVRVRASGHGLSLHAFELQVAAPGQDLAAIFAGAAIEGGSGPPQPPVQASIFTKPAGASVAVDGNLIANAHTPCRIPLQRGRHAIDLSLAGYSPAHLTNLSFTADQTINWVFQPDPRTLRKSFAVSATADRWVSEGVRVNKGDIVTVEAEGAWACGSGKEVCDANGYPNNKTFAVYYKDPDTHRRQMPDANYGALLMRIGADGPSVLAGTSLRYLAPDAGLLYFDINEGTGNRYRQDNAGTVVVRLTVAPPAPASAP